MQNPIFQIPPETYQQLSDSERHLLDFIYKNLPRMSELSILKLSEEASVSTATIVRLMKKLGFDGYTSFKYSIKNNSHAMEDEPIKASVDTQIREAIRKNELEVIQTIQMLDTRQQSGENIFVPLHLIEGFNGICPGPIPPGFLILTA